MLAFSVPRLFACSCFRSLFWLSSAGPFFPGSFWRLPVLPLGSVLHAGASVLEARGGSATANLAHGHSFARPLCWAALSHARLVCARPHGSAALVSLFQAQAALALSCPVARHSPAIARLAFSHHCARRFPAICCSGAQASWRLVAGDLRSPVIGAPRQAAALWRLATPGAQGSPAIGRSDDQPPWRSAALALTHSGAQLLRALIHAFTWPTAPRSPDTAPRLRPL